MKARVFILFACMLSPLFARAAEPAGKAPDATALAQWVAELDADSFDAREAAQSRLITLDIDAVPALRTILASTTDAEIHERLQRVVHRLLRPRWLTDLEAAKAQARGSGRPVMVFSSIGEVDGFS